MDSTDAALLRGMMRNHTYDFAGIDPRRSVSDLAEFAGVSRNTAQVRLRAWRNSGFQTPSSVYPNPDLFHCRFAGQYLRAESLDAASEVVSGLARGSELSLVYMAGSWMDHSVWMGVLFVEPNGRSPRPPQGKDLPPAGSALTPRFPIRFPASTMKMLPNDWRILRQVRSEPSQGISRVAAALELSVRHVRRRLDVMIDGNAIFFLPHFEFARARGTVALVSLIMLEDAESSGVLGELGRRFPEMIPAFPDTGEGLRAVSGAPRPPRTLQAMIPLRVAHESAFLAAELRKIPGVIQVLVTYPIRDFEHRPTFDRHLPERQDHGPPQAGRSRPRAQRSGVAASGTFQ